MTREQLFLDLPEIRLWELYNRPWSTLLSGCLAWLFPKTWQNLNCAHTSTSQSVCFHFKPLSNLKIFYSNPILDTWQPRHWRTRARLSRRQRCSCSSVVVVVCSGGVSLRKKRQWRTDANAVISSEFDRQQCDLWKLRRWEIELICELASVVSEILDFYEAYTLALMQLCSAYFPIFLKVKLVQGCHTLVVAEVMSNCRNTIHKTTVQTFFCTVQLLKPPKNPVSLQYRKELQSEWWGGVGLNLALFSQFTLANCRMCASSDKMGLSCWLTGQG